MGNETWQIHNPGGKLRVIVTKDLPGERWLRVLDAADCRTEVCTSQAVCNRYEIAAAIGSRCDGAIGQLTEPWGDALFAALEGAGGKAYSNYAVGHNNVDIEAATRHGIAVGNTPGVLTETTAEMAMALTFAAGRRVVEADSFMRSGGYQGWLPTLFMGVLFHRGTVGVIGAGRIGSAYARAMVEGHKMNLIYYDLYQATALEEYLDAYAAFLRGIGQEPISWKRATTPEEALATADVVSLHPILDESSYHLINAQRLGVMKENAILVNASRGPVVDEAALVEHCRAHPRFRAALDVFEHEPAMADGLAELPNVVVVPHIASATSWTREGMATLAARNIAAVLAGYPAWAARDIGAFLGDEAPQAAPSILNAETLGMATTDKA